MAERERVETRAERTPVAIPAREADLEAQADLAAEGKLRIGGSAPAASSAPPPSAPVAVREALAREGRPLESGVQRQMEQRLGADLRHVRVHENAPAAAALSAKAFAWGRDVVMRPGLLAPQTGAGAELLAHELAHTLQRAPMILLEGDKAPPDKPVPAGVSFKFRVAVSEEMNSDALLAEFKRQYTAAQTSEAERIRISNTPWEWIDKTNPRSVSKADVKAGYVLLDVTDNGLKPVSQEDKEKQEQALAGIPFSDREKIDEEADKRYRQATNNAPKSANAEYWNAIRGKLIETRMALDNLPPEIRAILFSPDAEKVLSPAEYERALRIGQKLAAMDPQQLKDWQSRVTATTDDLGVFEASLDAYLTQEAETKAAAQAQEQRKSNLLKLSDLYSLYRRHRAVAKLASLPAHDGATTDPIVAEAKAEEVVLEGQLHKALKANGFNSVAEFEAQIEAWKRGFEGMSQRLGNQLLDKLDHQFFLAEREYSRPEAAATLFAAIQHTSAPGAYARADDAGKRAIWRPSHGLDEGGGTNDDRSMEAAVESAAAQQRGDAAMATLKGAFPILSLPEFPIATLGRAADAGAVASIVAGYLSQRRKALKDARDEMNADPSLVYKYDRLRAAAYEDQGIQQGSMLDSIILDHISDRSIKQILKGLAIAALAIALTIVSFGTGTVAVLAAGGAFALSAASAWEAWSEYVKDSNAQDAGLLTDEPSVIWVVLAVAGAALDAAALARAVTAVRALKPAILTFNKTGDLAAFSKAVAAAKLPAATEKAILEAAAVQAKRAADVADAAKIAAQGKVGWIQRMGAAGEAASENVLKAEGATVKNLNDFTPNAGNFPTLDLTTNKGFASVKVKGTHTPSLSQSSLKSYVRDFAKIANKDKIASAAAEVGANRKAIQDAGAWPAGLPHNASVDDIAAFMSKNSELWIPDDHVAMVVAELKQKAFADPARFGLNPNAPDLAVQIDALAQRVRSMGIKSNEIDDIVTPLVKAGPESLPTPPKPPPAPKAATSTPPAPTAAVPKPAKAPKPPKPAKPAPVPKPPPYSATNKLNLNTATVEELKRLPGVGDVLAEKIVKARTDWGGFDTIDDLLEVEGIGQKVLDKFKSVVQP